MFEHLAGLEERGKFLKDTYRRYVDAIRENNKYEDKKWPLDKPYSVEDSVKHLISGVDTCKRWAANYKNRTHLYENTTPLLKRTIVRTGRMPRRTFE